MNIKLNIVLFKGKKHADDTHPIQLQYEVNGIPKRKTIHKCLEKDWDKKAKRVKSKAVNSVYINSLISEKYAEAERELIKVMNGQEPSGQFFKMEPFISLDSVIELELQRFKAEKKISPHSHLLGYQIQLNQFTDIKKLNILHMDLAWYEKFATFLSLELVKDGKVVKKPNIGSTAQKKVKTIRRMVEKHSKVKSSEDVKSFKVPSKKSVKQKLSPDELKRIEDLELPTDQQISVVRDLFLLQVYLRGSRVGALLMAYSDQFKDGRYVAANGTGKNNVGSKLIPRAQQIVDKYYGKYERLFPIYTWQPNPKLSDFDNEKSKQKKKEASTSIVNKYLRKLAVLAEIDKPISSHIARHTFARMAINKINNPMVTMELLGHKSLAVHQDYLNDIRRDDMLDQANDDIFG